KGSSIQMRQFISSFPGFLIFSLVFLGSCTSKRQSKTENVATAFGSKEFAESLVSEVQGRWFKTVDRFSLKDSKGEAIPHLFFDAFPRVNPEEKTLNFIVTTPENYPTQQKLDMASGQLYMTRRYCRQKDAWGTYKGELNLPPFTDGFVPRILDQLNRPQRIIVFGQDGYYQKYFKTNFFDARIVGAFIEQSCPQGGCLEKGSWLSRLVLIGVQKGNKTYEAVKNVTDLKQIVDWARVKAFVENSSGQNLISQSLYPSMRMGAVVDASQAFHFLKENSHFFTNKNLKKMRIGCYKMYDYLWKDFNKSTAQKDDVVLKQLEDKNQKFFNSDKTKITKKVEKFHTRFAKNFIQFNQRYKTCSKYVYPSSINANPERHWFFAYLDGFHKLHDLGYYYDCSRNVWSPNPYISKNERVVSVEKQFRGCNDQDIDNAMETMPRFFELLKERTRPTYRYVDYDKSTLGTHSKLYSWVEHDNKVLSCSKGPEDKYFKHRLPTFLKDIRWKRLGKKQ
ncbi:MAG: hypothetical protein KC478_17310, partial [Bacteriovoracaceae bacterium]|nr:hypothetical protein [Bacteriovoracaceae bacterium]